MPQDADPAAAEPLRNRLFAALPSADRQRWARVLEPVTLPVGMVLHDAGVTMSHAYFPTSAIVSMLHVTENGASAEIAQIGREGMVGIALVMGGGSTPSQAVVNSAGRGLRMAAPMLREAFTHSVPVMKVLLRYTQALIAQMAQTAVCNRHHRLDQQLCRWLLFSLDRLSGNEVVVTQELIARMLGVRREGVTEAALALQRDGLIRYRRGHILVLDRPGLERCSCECYAVVRGEYARLFPDGLG